MQYRTLYSECTIKLNLNGSKIENCLIAYNKEKGISFSLGLRTVINKLNDIDLKLF